MPRPLPVRPCRRCVDHPVGVVRELCGRRCLRSSGRCPRSSPAPRRRQCAAPSRAPAGRGIARLPAARAPTRGTRCRGCRPGRGSGRAPGRHAAPAAASAIITRVRSRVRPCRSTRRMVIARRESRPVSRASMTCRHPVCAALGRHGWRRAASAVRRWPPGPRRSRRRHAAPAGSGGGNGTSVPRADPWDDFVNSFTNCQTCRRGQQSTASTASGWSAGLAASSGSGRRVLCP